MFIKANMVAAPCEWTVVVLPHFAGTRCSVNLTVGCCARTACSRLSEPLLKLRPRSDLVNTLLVRCGCCGLALHAVVMTPPLLQHEMIHAYLFLTQRDRDRDGHGPSFKAHMKRINEKGAATAFSFSVASRA